MRVVALAGDLMDESRLRSAVDGLEVIRDAAAAAGADCVLVDVARHPDAVAALRSVAPSARIVAYGPHVDDEALARASADGADEVLPRSKLFRDPAAALAR